MVDIVVLIVNALTIVVLAHVVTTWILPPYHPFRETLDRFVEPMLMPIRRVLPFMGGLDFSPFILLLLIQLIGRVLIQLLIR